MSGLDRFGRVSAALSRGSAAKTAQSAGLGGELLFDLPTPNLRVLQDAAINGRVRVFQPGAYPLDEPILIGSNTRVELAPNVLIRCTGQNRHNWIRTGNADFVGALNVQGVWILCSDFAAGYADSTAYGTLEYATGPARLRWTAPGDTAGVWVDVSGTSVVNAWFSLPSGTAGKSLHVITGGAAFAGGAQSRQVRIEPVTGAEAVTWVRASNVVTVTQADHTKRRGDFVIVFFGGSAWHGYVKSVSGDTWSFDQAAADGGGAATCYSLRNIDYIANGASVDFGGSRLSGPLDGKGNMAAIMFAVNDLHAEPPNVTDNTKYATYIAGCSGFSVFGARLLSGTNDCVHVCGPAKNWNIDDVIAEAGDNIVGIGCTDYSTYNLFWPSNGTIDIENYVVSNVEARDTLQEPVRLYLANNGWLRNGVIENISGTVESANAMVSVITDNNALSVDAGNTNVDGLKIRSVDGALTSGAEMRQVTLTGTGVRKGISIESVPWKKTGVTTSGSIRIDCPYIDIEIKKVRSPRNTSVAGNYVDVGGLAAGARLEVRDVLINQADGASHGGNHRPVLVNFTGATALAEQTIIDGVFCVDTSASGSSKTCLFYSAGKKTRLSFRDIRLTSTAPASRRPDSLARFTSAAENGSVITCENVDADVDFGVVMDGGVPAELLLLSYRQPHGQVIHGAVSAGSPIKIDGAGVNVSSLLSATLTNLQVDVRGAIACDGSRVSSPQDGALIRNTNPAFGTGTGLYYRAGATWVKLG